MVRVRFQVVAVLALLAVGLGGRAEAEEITIGGTGSALGVMRLLGDAFSGQTSGASVTILPSLGSGGGIKALVAAKIDVAVSARPLTDEERALPIAETYYGRTPLAFVANDVPDVAGLSSAEIVDIYRGERVTWPDGRPVRLVLRPKSETDAKLLMQTIEGLGEPYERARQMPGMPVAYNDRRNAELLTVLEGSLGTVTLSQLRSEMLPLRPLKLDGVEPSVENLQNGAYPLWKDYWLVTASQPGTLVEAFSAFVRSPEGRAILQRTAHDVSIRSK